MDVVASVDSTLLDGAIIKISGKLKDVFRTVQKFGKFISDDDHNDYFECDDEQKIITILPNKFNSSNPSAELYRFCSKIIPAAYIAKENGYRINIDRLKIKNVGNLDVIKEFLGKFN